MPSINYFRDIPNGPNDPSDDQPLMQINTNAVDDIFAVDHYSFGTTGNLDGWHKKSIYPSFALSPAVGPPTLVGQGAVYTKNVGGGVIQLFYRRENNGPEIQLSGPLSATANGYTTLAGGVIIQWGTKTPVGNGAGSVTFATNNINFPNNCFVVVVTEKRTASPSGVDQIYVQTKSATGFTYFSTTSGTGFASFDWIAIGN